MRLHLRSSSAHVAGKEPGKAAKGRMFTSFIRVTICPDESAFPSE
jgi:hypothetical protein